MFISLGIIGKQTDAYIGIWLDIDLAAQHVAVAVVALHARWCFQIAVAFAPCTRQANTGNVSGNRHADASLEIHKIVIAVTRVRKALDFGKVRSFRGYVQRPSRCVAAEQRALRTTQNFKALKVDKITQSNARTRLVYTVNEYAYGAFKAGVIPRRPDAADFD